MNTVDIKIFTLRFVPIKVSFHKVINFLRSLTKPEITRQRHFELIDIEYYWIKDESARIERVESNTSIGRNVMNVDDIEDFAKL